MVKSTYCLSMRTRVQIPALLKARCPLHTYNPLSKVGYGDRRMVDKACLENASHRFRERLCFTGIGGEVQQRTAHPFSDFCVCTHVHSEHAHTHTYTHRERQIKYIFKNLFAKKVQTAKLNMCKLVCVCVFEYV